MGLKRMICNLTLIVASMFAVVLSASSMSAQQPSSADQLRTLMDRRQEMSHRSVYETTKRRFEDGRSDTTFPSDAARNTKGGVIRALTPAEQKALKHNERGLQLFSKGELDNAIKEYQQALSFDPKLAAAHNNLGSAYFAAGRFDDAAKSFRAACELEPDLGQAFFNLALVQIKLGQEKEANETLVTALHAYNSAGEAHYLAGRLKEAEEAFRGMLQIDTEYPPALIRLGLVYNAAGRYDEAASHVRRALQREPTNFAAHEVLAETLYGAKKYEDAAASAEKALKLSPKSANAHYLAGMARASLGQRDAALIHLTSLQQLNSPDLSQQLLNFINEKAPAKP